MEIKIGSDATSMRKTHADFIGIYDDFLTSCAEYIGAREVTNSPKCAETLGIYGISFACNTETIRICGVSSTSMAQP